MRARADHPGRDPEEPTADTTEPTGDTPVAGAAGAAAPPSDPPAEPPAPAAASPGAPRVVDLADVAADVRTPNRATEAKARQRAADLLVAPGSLGELTRLGVWWAGVAAASPPPEPRAVRALVLAADHGIGVRGVSALPLGHTAVAARALDADASPGTAAARVAGARLRVVEVDVAGPAGPRSQPFDVGDGLDDATLQAALARGVDLADEEIDAGCDLLVLGELHVAGTTTAAAVIGAAQRRRVLDVVGRGSGIDDWAWMRKAAAVRDGLRRARRTGRDALAVLRAVGAVDVAVATAVIVRAAARRTPVVLDGPVTLAAAVLAHRLAPSSRQWLLAPERTTEPAAQLALDALSLSPVLDLGVRTGGAVPGLLAVGVLRTACAVLAESATSAEAWPEPAGPAPVPRDVGDAT